MKRALNEAPASSRAAAPVTCATSQVGTAAPKPSSSTLIWVERSGCGQAKEIAKYSQEIAFYMQPGLLRKCRKRLGAILAVDPARAREFENVAWDVRSWDNHVQIVLL